MFSLGPRNPSSSAGDASGRDGSVPEQAQLSPELTHIARTVARDYSVAVLIGTPGGGSYANIETRQITLDPEHLRSDNEARFVAAHEGAHLSDTPGFEELGLTQQEVAELSKKLGLFALKNVIEDPAINDRFVRDYPALAEDTLSAYPRAGAELGAIDHPEVRAQAAALGFVPRYARALAALLTDWSEFRHIHGFDASAKKYLKSPYLGPKTEDREIQQFLKDSLKEARLTILEKYSSSDAGPWERLRAGATRHFRCEQILYPHLKKLLDSDLKQATEERRNASANGGDRSASESSDKDSTRSDSASSSTMQEPSAKEPSTQEPGNKEQRQEPGTRGESSGEADASSASANGGDRSASESSDKDSTRSDSASSGTMQEPGTRGQSPKTSITAEELRQALEALAQFDDALREALRSAADKQGDAPGAIQAIAEKHENERAAELDAASRQAFGAATLAARESILQHLAPYDQFYLRIADDIDRVASELQQVFIPEAHFRWKRDQSSGSRINMNAALHFEATGDGADRLFEQRIDPKRPDVGIVLLLDRSGSMDGERINQGVLSTIFAKEVFQRIGIRCAVIGFSESQHIHADFSDSTDSPEVRTAIMEGLGTDGGTADADALDFAVAKLDEANIRGGAVVVISDAGSGQEKELRKLVRQVEAGGRLVVHFGIGSGTTDSNGLYTRSFGDLTTERDAPNSFFSTFAREMERLALELL